MANLNSRDLLHALLDACRRYTDDVLFIDGTNPYGFLVNQRKVRVFVGNVHWTNRDSDEYRIQCSGDLPTILRASAEQGETVIVLGYYSPADVFCAWDPDRMLARLREVQRFSIYTRLSLIERAQREGISSYIDSTNQVILMYRSEFMGLYIENAVLLHGANQQDLTMIASAYRSTSNQDFSVGRQRIHVTRNQYERSPQFRSSVLGAYSHKCAMCGIQLGLIDAAHIVPHAHPNGSDSITNGVALCALHHRSFDAGLLFIDIEYSIKMNDVKIEYLEKTGRSAGIGRFRRGLNSDLLLPADPQLHPAVSNLVLGNRLRGIAEI